MSKRANQPATRARGSSSLATHWHSIRPLIAAFVEDPDPSVVIPIGKGEKCIVWDLKAVCQLMRCLKRWALDKVPGRMIGAFLTLVLYGGDYHMNEMLTSMVDEGKSAVYITREVMAFYQIWDNNHRIPLWTTLIDDDGIEESLHASGRNLAMANPASSAVAVAEHARRLKVDKLNIIRAEWPSFVSDLTDVQIDELANHVRNGEKGVFRPLLSVPESPKVIEELRRLDSHKKDPRRDLDLIQFDGSGYSLTDSAPQRAVWEQDKPLPVIPKKKDVGVQTFTRDGSRWI